MIGVTFLRSACFLESGVDSRRHPNAAKRLLRQRESSRRLIQVGIVSLIFLAIWQVPLFIGNLNQIDQQRAVESRQISARLIAVEKALRQALQDIVDETWKRFTSSGQVSSKQISIDREQPREALLERIRVQQQKANLAVNQRGNQARFELFRNLGRNLLLCLIDVTGYWGLGQRLA
jgi:hypothetical protein